MLFAVWALIIGTLLIMMTLSGSMLKRLPVSTAMFYLAVGYGLGPEGLNLLTPDPIAHAGVLERLTECALLISLFASGLKLGVPLTDKHWWLPLRLAFVSMAITVGLLSLVGIWALHLAPGVAILLAAILAPTDPVLASEVQVEEAGDRDRVRFGLTGEGGLNDGTAYAFISLGLSLLGLHEAGEFGWRWIVLDVLWGFGGGLLIGGCLGMLVGRLVLFLRTEYQEAVGLDEFLSLGLIALAYGCAMLCYCSGFLAVFAAGLALQRTESRTSSKPASLVPMAAVGLPDKETREAIATSPDHAGAYLMQAVRNFNSQLENIVELTVVLLIGAILAYVGLSKITFWFPALLFLVIRPLSVWLGLRGMKIAADQQWLMSWFGIRGVGSLYYLLYAINHGLALQPAQQLIALTLATVVASIVFHGISMSPLMKLYGSSKARRGK